MKIDSIQRTGGATCKIEDRRNNYKCQNIHRQMEGSEWSDKIETGQSEWYAQTNRTVLKKIGMSRNRDQTTNFVTAWIVYLFPILFKYLKPNPWVGPSKRLNSVHSGKMDDPRLEQQPPSQSRCIRKKQRMTNGRGNQAEWSQQISLTFLPLVLSLTMCARMCVTSSKEPGT